MTTRDDDDILAAARAGFQSEASELLEQFEQALLAMEQQPDDHDAMNSAFRAAHTMKGTAGLFGCEALVAFTHDVESLLDDMRAGALALNDDVMAVLLQSRDHLEHLLGELDLPASSAPVAARSAELGTQLRALRGGASAADAHGTPPVADGSGVAPGAAQEGQQGWHIALRMGPDALRNGLDPLSFIRYLSTLGTVARIHTATDAVPDLPSLDPETCHLAFDIDLHSERPRIEVEQAFDFLMDDCELAITPLAHEASPAGQGKADPDAGIALLPEGIAVMPQAIATNTDVQQIEHRSGQDRRVADTDRRTGARDRKPSEDTRFIRVRADKLDALIDLIGELVIASSGAQMVAQLEHSARFVEAAARIHDLVQSARDGALGLRMVPIGESFARFHRVVRDVSKQLGKDVELEITGGETEMDKSMVETIGDPLMHLVRNSLDHGIETQADRLAAGKPAQGRLALHAYHESGSITIEVSDDGKGLDRERILNKAIEQGLVAADAVLDDEAVYQLIFKPGFSTAQQVTNLSGRGVGMDVVKSNVEALRGQIRIASQPGKGTTIQIRLPLTLAIIDGFLTSVAGVSYVLPLEIVAECIEMPRDCASHPQDAAGCFDLRGEVMPYISLRGLFKHAGMPPSRQSLIVVRTAVGRLGLLVDRLHGEYQTVIKPLGDLFRQVHGIAGSTILGSGEVALILDVAALEQRAADIKRQINKRASIPDAQPVTALSSTHS
jgi:two-component system chemotaxis sensor kinase CheA